MAINYTSFSGGGSILPANQILTAGQSLTSDNGVYNLVLRPDGELVIVSAGNVIWRADDTQPYSSTLYRKRMREPLQFMISNSGFLHDPGRGRIWIARTSDTLDHAYWYNNFLTITDDGNLIIYDNRDGTVRWARSGFVPSRLPRPKLISGTHDDGVTLKKWRFEF